MMISKKDRERAVIEEFLDAAGLVAKIQNSEEPDFLLDINDAGMVAVELTEFFQGTHDGRGSTKQMLAAQWQQLVYLLQNSPALSKGYLIHISLPSDRLLPKPSSMQSLASEIISIITASIGASDSSHIQIWDYQFREKRCAVEHIKTIDIWRYSPDRSTVWQCPNTMGGEVAVDGSFIDSLWEKTARTPTYRAKTGSSELWLVIHARDESGSTLSPDREDVEEAIRPWLPSSGFDKVWFYPGSGKEPYHLS